MPFSDLISSGSPELGGLRLMGFGILWGLVWTWFSFSPLWNFGVSCFQYAHSALTLT